MYRDDLLPAATVVAIANHLVTADRELLAAAGALAVLRREIERAVLSRKRYGPAYPGGEALIYALTDAQRRTFAAHEELVAADAALEHPSDAVCPMLPDPPRLGTRPPADARSREYWPAPFDPIGVLVWYLRYRPWWSTLTLAIDMLHDQRRVLRSREVELSLRCDEGVERERLPQLDELLTH